jgi:5S rRNA maturation endonuclease (ribonuclease M5)
MSLLEQLIKDDFGIKHESARWLKANEHDSLVFDKEKNKFFWNSQQIYGDVFTYLVKVRKWQHAVAKEFIKNNLTNSSISLTKITTPPVIYNKLVNVFFINGLDNRDYFYKRGLTDETINLFSLGFWDGWFTIPIFEDGQFKNFQLRREVPKKQIKLYYSGLGTLIFNGDLLKFVDEVFITEGPIDALILLQNGLPAISSAGGTIQSKHFCKFKNIKRINILFDDDEAGRKEAKTISKILGLERCFVYTFENFNKKGYDPVDFFKDGHTKDELLSLVYQYGRKLQ